MRLIYLRASYQEVRAVLSELSSYSPSRPNENTRHQLSVAISIVAPPPKWMVKEWVDLIVGFTIKLCRHCFVCLKVIEVCDIRVRPLKKKISL